MEDHKYGKEKKPEISFEIGKNLSDEEALKQGSELRRKGNLLLKSGKGVAETIFKCYDESLFRFKFILDDPAKANKDEYNFAAVEIAQTLLDKAAAFAEIGGPLRGDSDTYHGLLEQVGKYLDKLPSSEQTTEVLRLQAQALHELSKYKSDVCKDFGASEKLLVASAQKLVQGFKSNTTDEVALELLETVSESLQSGKKERQKNGKAVFHISGEFFVCRGIAGIWKSRYFTVDESSVVFYKNKKAWENGPVLASTKVKPSGMIMFGDIAGVSYHEKECPLIKPAIRPPALKNSFCLHIQTTDKLYDLLSPSGIPNSEYSKWPSVLTDAITTYRVKKDAKAIVTKKKGKAGSLLSFNFEDDDDESEEEQEETEVAYVGPKRSSLRISDGKKPTPSKRVSWISDNQLRTVLPVEDSKFPFYFAEEEPEEETTTEPVHSTLTVTDLSTKLESMTRDETIKVWSSLLDSLEVSQIKLLFLKVISNDPKQSLLAISKETIGQQNEVIMTQLRKLLGL